jgi:hypothetical protein
MENGNRLSIQDLKKMVQINQKVETVSQLKLTREQVDAILEHFLFEAYGVMPLDGQRSLNYDNEWDSLEIEVKEVRQNRNHVLTGKGSDNG